MLAILIMLPLALHNLDYAFYIGFLTRIMIFALAASSLNLILGYGGMVSFGHAAFFGVGAYTVGILAGYEIFNAWITWPAAVLVSALFALLVGAVSLRTRGVYFIMITLAFAQMIYYLIVSVKGWGADDGLPIADRSLIGFGIDLKNDMVFCYVVMLLLGAVLFLKARLLASRFGRALGAVRENELRAEAIGFPTFKIKLVAFVVAGGAAGLAGALIANQNLFVSPKLMEWHQSGILLIMVIMGGMGYLWGGVVGALVMLVLEETVSAYTIYWQMALGLLLLGIVLLAPRGLASLFSRKPLQ